MTAKIAPDPTTTLLFRTNVSFSNFLLLILLRNKNKIIWEQFLLQSSKVHL